jgi:hypothetical protein
LIVDLLMIARKIWRYRLVTLPVLVLTLCGAGYAVAVKEPVYETSSSYILINPPAPPTAEEIARDPTLGRVNADNPYTRFPDQSIIVSVLASTMGSEATRRALMEEGADPRYAVARSAEFGYSSPIVEISAAGSSPRAAIRSAELVSQAVSRELNRMQQAEGVDRPYRITTQQVDAPDSAVLRASGQLRTLVGVLALGAALLFVAISAADGLTTLRMERRGRLAQSHFAANDGLWLTQDEPGAAFSDLKAEDWPTIKESSSRGGGADPFTDLDVEAAVPTNGPAAGRRTPDQNRRALG